MSTAESKGETTDVFMNVWNTFMEYNDLKSEGNEDCKGYINQILDFLRKALNRESTNIKGRVQKLKILLWFFKSLGLGVNTKYYYRAPYSDGAYRVDWHSALNANVGTLMWYLLGANCKQAKTIADKLRETTNWVLTQDNDGTDLYDEKLASGWDANAILNAFIATATSCSQAKLANIDPAQIKKFYDVVNAYLSDGEVIMLVQAAVLSGQLELSLPQFDVYQRNMGDLTRSMLSKRYPNRGFAKPTALVAVLDAICQSSESADDIATTFGIFENIFYNFINKKIENAPRYSRRYGSGGGGGGGSTGGGTQEGKTGETQSPSAGGGVVGGGGGGTSETEEEQPEEKQLPFESPSQAEIISPMPTETPSEAPSPTPPTIISPVAPKTELATTGWSPSTILATVGNPPASFDAKALLDLVKTPTQLQETTPTALANQLGAKRQERKWITKAYSALLRDAIKSGLITEKLKAKAQTTKPAALRRKGK